MPLSPWRWGSLSAGISSGERWPWFMNSFNSSHYDKTAESEFVQTDRHDAVLTNITSNNAQLGFLLLTQTSSVLLIYMVLHINPVNLRRRPPLRETGLCCTIHAWASVCLHSLCCRLCRCSHLTTVSGPWMSPTFPNMPVSHKCEG